MLRSYPFSNTVSSGREKKLVLPMRKKRKPNRKTHRGWSLTCEKKKKKTGTKDSRGGETERGLKRLRPAPATAK